MLAVWREGRVDSLGPFGGGAERSSVRRFRCSHGSKACCARIRSMGSFVSLASLGVILVSVDLRVVGVVPGLAWQSAAGRRGRSLWRAPRFSSAWVTWMSGWNRSRSDSCRIRRLRLLPGMAASGGRVGPEGIARGLRGDQHSLLSLWKRPAQRRAVRERGWQPGLAAARLSSPGDGRRSREPGPTRGRVGIGVARTSRPGLRTSMPRGSSSWS